MQVQWRRFPSQVGKGSCRTGGFEEDLGGEQGLTAAPRAREGLQQVGKHHPARLGSPEPGEDGVGLPGAGTQLNWCFPSE